MSWRALTQAHSDLRQPVAVQASTDLQHIAPRVFCAPEQDSKYSADAEIVVRGAHYLEPVGNVGVELPYRVNATV